MIKFLLCFILPVYSHNCSLSSRVNRKEWGTLSGSERRDYINAVHCMQKTPPVLSSDQYPGVRHRMDDFTVVHMIHAPHVHANGALLAWHREFIWLWERALRQECAYQGYLPYWDWPLYANNLSSSPIFDGSSTSLSGDGDPNDNYCVTSGPFAHMQVNFPQGARPTLEVPQEIFEYTPHCLNRRINSTATAVFANFAVISRLLESPNITIFQERMDISMDPAVWAREFGPHTAGHKAMTGTMEDFFSSPQDPAFMLHHGMVDRMWTMWQAQNEGNHRWAINGSMTLYNLPLTPQLTLETDFDFGILGRSKKMRELMNPQGGEYCYGYI